jgi:signal transduction histidine kinase/CheY-like chemotaxis protein
MIASFFARLTDSINGLWTDRPRRTGLILTVSSAGLLMLAAALATVLTFRVDEATDWVEHTYKVRGIAAQAMQNLQDAEIALRDHILSPTSDSLIGYRDAWRPVFDNLREARRLVSDNPPQVDQIDEIDRLVEAYQALFDHAATITNTGPATVVTSLSRGDGEALRQLIRELFADFDATEAKLLRARQSSAEQLQALLLGITLLSLALAMVASTTVVTTSWSYIQELRAQSDALKAEAASRREAESRLLQTQKLELVGQLTAGIAHDFNNLLTIVIGNLDTVRRRIDSGTAADLGLLARPVETAAEGARRAAALTRKLLAFARQQPLAPTRLDLNRAVANMSDVLIRTVGESIKIETVLAAGLWPAFADPSHVDNAIVNLVVNARDAMPGGGRVTIETANAWLDEDYVAQFGDVAPGQYVLLSVSDTGPGIPPDILARVFEPFFTTKDVGKGTGLGLATIHGFVKQSKGHIRIYSEPGQGTTVKIYLPRLTDASLVAAAPESQEPSEAGAPNAQPGEVVLMVEDDDGVRDFARTALESLGYGVIAGSDGVEALALLREAERVDALFTDVVLPGGMNGRNLADEALRLKPGLAVLFTTGYTRNAIVHEGRLDPDVQLISKPYTRGLLARSLRRILDESRRRS